MSVLVHVTFDLNNAEPIDYANVREALEIISLRGFAISDDGRLVGLPHNTFLAKYNGPAAGVRDAVMNNMEMIFQRCGVQGRVFVSVGEGWAWKQGDF